MDRSYSDYIDIIDEVENIEQVIISDNKIKKCCYYTLELIKVGICNISKIQYVNININGKNKNKKNKTDTTVSSTDEDKEEEIVKETSVIEFACPMCKTMLAMKNELEIQKKETVNVRVFRQISN